MVGLLDRPDGGEVVVDGVAAWGLGDRMRAALRLSLIGFVFQERNLLSALSARDNVALPAWHRHGSRRGALARADELLERFGLAERAHAAVDVLSTGEAQRVAIARALVNSPSVVLADEPTGSLDSRSSAQVMEALAEVRSDGAALLIVTHDHSIAAAADRRLTMLDGKLR
jgi:ABC-type lipoprotein export system ATPase subunit